MVVFGEVGAMAFGVASFQGITIRRDASLGFFLGEPKLLVQTLDNSRWFDEGDFDVDEVLRWKERCDIVEEVVMRHKSWRCGW